VNALILGSADCLQADIEALLEIGPWGGLVIVVNESGVYYRGHIDHWVTMHGEKLDWWRSKREGSRDYTATVLPKCDGSSGGAATLFAVEVLGCERVVLVGMPMDTRPHLGRGAEWTPATEHRPWWLEQLPRFKDHVRSLSGWTRELLGAPDEEWLRGE